MLEMSRTEAKSGKALEFIRRAQDLVKGFDDWTVSLSSEWSCRTVGRANAIPVSALSVSKVYPGNVDMFPDLFVASQWNMARVSRLILAGIICRCAACIFAPDEDRASYYYDQASRLGIDMVTDILASIPYLLGWRGFENSFRHPCGVVIGQGGIGDGNALGAYFSMWPMFHCVVSDFATNEQRSYIIGRMKFIERSLGIKCTAMHKNVCHFLRS